MAKPRQIQKVPIILALLFVILTGLASYAEYKHIDTALGYLLLSSLLVTFSVCGFAETGGTIPTICDNMYGTIIFGAAGILINAVIGYGLGIGIGKLMKFNKKSQ